MKGFTALQDLVPEHLRGTYAGLAHPAVTDYLRDLGVTAVELLPVQQFTSEPDVVARGLTNYWGYNTIGFFAPHAAYSSSGDRGQQVTEFKQMVKAMHAAGLEVYLDVVYNHTAESGPRGPTLSFRGLDDLGYYQHVEDERRADRPATYWDVTGCGNTVAACRPDGAAADPRLAALLGHRDARRRLPLRPDAGDHAHRPPGGHARRAARPRSARTRCCGT